MSNAAPERLDDLASARRSLIALRHSADRGLLHTLRTLRLLWRIERLERGWADAHDIDTDPAWAYAHSLAGRSRLNSEIHQIHPAITGVHISMPVIVPTGSRLCPLIDPVAIASDPHGLAQALLSRALSPSPTLLASRRALIQTSASLAEHRLTITIGPTGSSVLVDDGACDARMPGAQEFDTLAEALQQAALLAADVAAEHHHCTPGPTFASQRPAA